MNQIKTVIFLLFLLVTKNSSANIDLLRKGDSLFNDGNYVEAKVYYDSLFFNEELFTNSMLLKLSHIEENLGNFERSVYYLSKYQKNNNNNDPTHSAFQHSAVCFLSVDKFCDISYRPYLSL